MELAAFASFGILVIAWIALPLRTPTAAAPAAEEPLAEPVAA
jgi:hypothetical protein